MACSTYSRLWLLFPLLLCFLLPLAVSAAANCIAFGVNGHSITQAPYSLSSYKSQVSYLSSLHLSYYRIDVPLESDLSGRVRSPSPSQNFSLLLDLLAAASPPITLYPTVFPTDQPYSPDLSYAALFNLSRLEGERWTRLYGHLWSVFELSNERDNVCIHNSDGRDPVTGYNQTCLEHLMAQMTGFAAGVKAVNPRLRIVIDYSWVHFGYLDALVSHGMQWDILAPHWYSNMQAINSSYKEIPDVLQYVIDRYKRPIWMTETNTGDGSMHLPPANQTEWILDSLRIMDSYPQVQAYMIYELFDEKQWGNQTGEAFFGLLEPASGGGWQWKEVGQAYGRHVERYQQRVCKQCAWVSDTSNELKCADGEETGDMAKVRVASAAVL